MTTPQLQSNFFQRYHSLLNLFLITHMFKMYTSKNHGDIRHIMCFHSQRNFIKFITFMLTTNLHLKTATSTFPTKSISQSSPIVSANNTITVTLESNATLASSTLITITGFDGATANTHLQLFAISGGDGGNSIFSNTFFTNNGTLVLNVLFEMNQSTIYSFSFVLINPSYVVVSPSISIGINGAAVAMDVPNLPLLGVNNGQNPMV